ncbi:hypothetical protein ACWEQ0_19345 [Nocardia thailandica]
MFEEKISGKLKVADRPGLQTALDYLRPALAPSAGRRGVPVAVDPHLRDLAPVRCYDRVSRRDRL